MSTAIIKNLKLNWKQQEAETWGKWTEKTYTEGLWNTEERKGH